MEIRDIAIPEVYKESADFRFFIKWFADGLGKLQYDTENFFDLYDPLRCPEELLWLLADTMGFKFDDRLPTSFNRLVLLYFISMIRNRGSRDGITIAAETNLAQFNILEKGKSNKVLYNRLEDTTIPVNSVYVSTHPADGYIDVIYFSTKVPLDACIEYTRPLGMYVFQHAGVRMDSKTRIAVDVRLTDERDVGMSYGPTQVGHYRREDYARMQKTTAPTTTDISHKRNSVWYRNSYFEDLVHGDATYGSGTDSSMNPGYRALQSLQLSNNEEIVKSLIDPIFSLGYQPQTIDVSFPDDYLVSERKTNLWNLRYDKELDELYTYKNSNGDFMVSVVDSAADELHPTPAVNPIMSSEGDAISLNSENTAYTGDE